MSVSLGGLCNCHYICDSVLSDAGDIVIHCDWIFAASVDYRIIFGSFQFDELSTQCSSYHVGLLEQVFFSSSENCL